MKIDWLKKISSRKFWVCLIGFVSALLVAFHVGENDIAQVSAIISAFGTLIVYIIAEGNIDAATAGANQVITNNTTETTKTQTTVMSKDLNQEKK